MKLRHLKSYSFTKGNLKNNMSVNTNSSSTTNKSYAFATSVEVKSVAFVVGALMFQNKASILRGKLDSIRILLKEVSGWKSQGS